MKAGIVASLALVISISVHASVECYLNSDFSNRFVFEGGSGSVSVKGKDVNVFMNETIGGTKLLSLAYQENIDADMVTVSAPAPGPVSITFANLASGEILFCSVK
jgi:hypothetical protein